MFKFIKKLFGFDSEIVKVNEQQLVHDVVVDVKPKRKKSVKKPAEAGSIVQDKPRRGRKPKKKD